MKTTTLAALCDTRNVRATVTCGTTRPMPEWARSNGSTAWTVRLTYNGRRLTVPFFTGRAITAEPTVADVLGCLISDTMSVETGEGAYSRFETWCEDLGLNPDSRTDFATYNACISIAKRVRAFLGADFAEFAAAEN